MNLKRLHFTFENDQSRRKWRNTLFLVISSVIIDKIYAVVIIANFENPSHAQVSLIAQISSIELFLWVVFLAPLAETAVFQSLIIEISLIIFPYKYFISTIIGVISSSYLFAISHAYSDLFVLVMIFPGFVYSSVYLISKHFKVNAFWVTCSAHALSNMIVFIYNSALSYIEF